MVKLVPFVTIGSVGSSLGSMIIPLFSSIMDIMKPSVSVLLVEETLPELLICV
jgi:hypothetical protein